MGLASGQESRKIGLLKRWLALSKKGKNATLISMARPKAVPKPKAASKGKRKVMPDYRQHTERRNLQGDGFP